MCDVERYYYIKRYLFSRTVRKVYGTGYVLYTFLPATYCAHNSTFHLEEYNSPSASYKFHVHFQKKLERSNTHKDFWPTYGTSEETEIGNTTEEKTISFIHSCRSVVVYE